MNPSLASTDSLSAEAQVVHKYLDASMTPDPELAATFVADPVDITFTGGRKYNHPSGPTEFNASRYKWVKKSIERYDVAESESGTIVYSIGTLYGEWPDGTPFEGNRYIDRFEVENGKITKMDVWNDSAEIILTRQVALT